MKRQGLIPFPRVGRSGALVPRPRHGLPAAVLLLGASDVAKRANGGESNGMWFGPRLGRRNKRSVDLNDLPWALITLTDAPSTRRHDEFLPRLGRESLEVDDDLLVDEERDEELGGRRTAGGRHSRETEQHAVLTTSTHQ